MKSRFVFSFYLSALSIALLQFLTPDLQNGKLSDLDVKNDKQMNNMSFLLHYILTKYKQYTIQFRNGAILYQIWFMEKI